MREAWWEIRNGYGDYVCRRRTKRECVALLDTYTVDKPSRGWSNGPYTVWRMTAERRLVHRATHTKGKER